MLGIVGSMISYRKEAFACGTMCGSQDMSLGDQTPSTPVMGLIRISSLWGEDKMRNWMEVILKIFKVALTLNPRAAIHGQACSSAGFPPTILACTFGL